MKTDRQERIERNRQLRDRMEAQAAEARQRGDVKSARRIMSNVDEVVQPLIELDEREQRRENATSTWVHAGHFVNNILSGPSGSSILDDRRKP